MRQPKLGERNRKPMLPSTITRKSRQMPIHQQQPYFVRNKSFGKQRHSVEKLYQTNGTPVNSCSYGPKNLTGSFFITFFNCSINIAGNSTDSKIFKFEVKPVIIPLHFVEVNETANKIDVMEEMHQLQSHNRKRINLLEANKDQKKSINVGTLIIISVIITTIFIYITREIRDIRNFVKIQEPSTS